MNVCVIYITQKDWQLKFLVLFLSDYNFSYDYQQRIIIVVIIKIIIIIITAVVVSFYLVITDSISACLSEVCCFVHLGTHSLE